MVELSPLRQLRMGQLPKMVSWYDPRLLARIGVRTIISSVFGQYADQRLIQAVTDPCDDKDLATRYDYCDPNVHDRCIAPDENGAYWIDYVADVGDGFESTYTIAYLLAQDDLDVRQAGRLRHGEILIMGGDQCYPQATREDYKKKLLTPYNWAFTVANPDRKLFALPGNHDWYDGLNSFDSLFCAARDRNCCLSQPGRSSQPESGADVQLYARHRNNTSISVLKIQFEWRSRGTGYECSAWRL